MSLEVEAVSVGHDGRTVVAGVDLAVRPGELVTLLGSSGSGKTTLLRAVAGLHPTRAGTIRLDGRDVTRVPAERRRVGLVPQEGALFPHRTVAANVGYGVARRDRRARVAEMLELVGLADRGSAMPHELSGGQRQRVALARALAPAPPVLLLDEPFSGLDTALRVRLRGETAEILRRAGAASVLVTHDVGEALAVSDRIVALGGGRVLAAGTPREVYERPSSRAAAELLGTAIVLTGRPRDSATIDTALGRLATHGGHAVVGEVTAVLRPEQLALGSGPAAVTGRVERHEYRGSTTVLEVSVAGAGTVAVHTTDANPPGPGSAVSLVVAGPVHVLSPA